MDLYWRWLTVLAVMLTLFFTIILVFVCLCEFDKETPFEKRRRQFLYSIRSKNE